MRKNIFACLFIVHNTKSLSRHEQVRLIRLRFEGYFPHQLLKKLAHLLLKRVSENVLEVAKGTERNSSDKVFLTKIEDLNSVL